EESGTTIVAVGGTPGKAFEAQGGEIWMPLHHLYESGEYAEAADRGRELIEAHPEYAGPLYNLACCESLAGRTDDAIRHLRLAIGRHEPARPAARARAPAPTPRSPWAESFPGAPRPRRAGVKNPPPRRLGGPFADAG